MDETKDELRTRMRWVRSGIPNRADRAAALWANVVARCQGAPTVMAYIGTGSEPDTTQLIAQLESRGINVVLPRVEGTEIVAVPHVTGEPLVPGAYGIPVPEGVAIDPATIDVVVVPGLAFTRDGRRLGQGGGFYDRFLPLLRDDCVTIGVCFAEQIVDDLVVEPHDRKVDEIVTDAVQE